MFVTHDFMREILLFANFMRLFFACFLEPAAYNKHAEINHLQAPWNINR